MIRGQYYYFGDDITIAHEIRKKVFQDGQGVAEEIDFDDIDQQCIHAVLFDNAEKPVATGRIYYDGEIYKIGRIAVLPEERGKKYGDFIVRMLVDKGFLAGAKEVQVDAQLHAVGFYEKIGFVTYGDIFEENKIQHQSMKLVYGSLCKECQKEC